MIYRATHDEQHPFTQINNEVFSDNRLSWKAKGVLCHILSNKETWQIYETELTSHVTDKKTATHSALLELIAAGYIIKSENRIKNDRGHFEGYEYNVYEIPLHKKPIHVRKSNVGKSCVGKTDTNNTNRNNINQNNSNNGVENNSTKALTFIEYQETKTVSQSVSDCIDYYLRTYEQKQDKQLKLKLDQWDKVTENLLYIEAIGEDISVDDMKQLIDTHFDHEKYGDCDWNILHFITNGVKNNRFREALY